MVKFMLDDPERGGRTGALPFKAFRDWWRFGAGDIAPTAATVGFFFLKRLSGVVLSPSLDFLLGDALNDLALVEEGKAFEVVLP